MPLNEKGRKILENMRAQYGAERGTRIFHASRNEGTIKDVERDVDRRVLDSLRKRHG